MKKRSLDSKILALLLVTVVLTMLCACGSQNSKADYGYTSTGGAAWAESKASGSYPTSANAAQDEYAEESPAVWNEGDSPMPEAGPAQQFADKIIYSANVYIETLHFDQSVEDVYAMVEACGGFMESSYVSGNNYASTYYKEQSYRTASFTIRVPAQSFTAVKSSLDQLGYVTSEETYSDNITTQFYDTQSRLEAYRSEAQRLTEMLGKADSVEDMIIIESRLSDVQYNIDSLTSRLKNWQNSVDYSTLNLTLREVAEIRVQTKVTETYWQRMGKGFVSTMNSIANFFKEVFMWIVVAFPVLLLLAVVTIIIILIVKRSMRKYEKKQAQKTAAAQGRPAIPAAPNTQQAAAAPQSSIPQPALQRPQEEIKK